jgi:uncharacterized protein
MTKGAIMNKNKKLLDFVTPYYKDKDIMHDISHIERISHSLSKILKNIDIEVDYEILEYALSFHGIVYSHKAEIIEWLTEEGFSEEKIQKIIDAAFGSQKDRDALSLEGKLLHDAHEIEGGKTFLFVKSLITGSVRGQSLEETIGYIDKNVGTGFCYFEYAKNISNEQKEYLKESMSDLKNDVGMI